MASASGELLDYSQTVGSFFMLTPKGQLFALDHLYLSRDFSRIVPRINAVNLHAVIPLVEKIVPSSFILVLHPGDRANAYFLTDGPFGH